MSTTPGGAPATLRNTAVDIIAGLGNDSPSQSQITAMETWILAEKPAGLSGTDAASNNPLNVDLAGVPSGFGATSSGIQPSDPIAQFPDLTSGIAGNIAWLQRNSNAAPMVALFATPQNLTTAQVNQALAAGAAPWSGDVGRISASITGVTDMAWNLVSPSGANSGANIGMQNQTTTTSGTNIGSGLFGSSPTLSFGSGLAYYGITVGLVLLGLVLVIVGFNIIGRSAIAKAA